MMTREQQLTEFLEFCIRMKRELEENMWKGGWDRCSPHDLLRRVYQELQELEDEMALAGTEAFSLDRTMSEAADVANMCMMVVAATGRLHERKIDDACRRLEEERQSDDKGSEDQIPATSERGGGGAHTEPPVRQVVESAG